ncbi:DNA repair protein RecO [Rufibacter glacialis]|uniref:DNA repair protein RecO n=1 Tax=Rufibacter glacialis TaxID=1259555 RepID=A0A5M8QPG6_9BACT|nr:DNA repair protein RecO [Rufibacter glacialis]KAA6437188.1 DNA repair protein RecO [Rufibacter glacialis]GGK61323.1 DNA repair protein RecO [Rufibacter glacialis]
MLVKTRGIVLSFIKFKESSIIVRIYTEELGLQSYIVNSVRKKGTASRIALFQPFTLLDMVVYPSGKGGLTRISEYKCSHPFTSAAYDIRKSSILLFLSEVVSRTVREEEENRPLFEFLYNAIVLFDELETGFENFHLAFLLQLAGYLGFGVSSAEEVITQVAFETGGATALGNSLMQLQQLEPYLKEVIQHAEDANLPNGKVRRELLHLLVRYFQLHVDQLGEIRSLPVLSEVLSE